jgi:hypothetical protein
MTCRSPYLTTSPTGLSRQILKCGTATRVLHRIPNAHTLDIDWTIVPHNPRLCPMSWALGNSGVWIPLQVLRVWPLEAACQLLGVIRQCSLQLTSQGLLNTTRLPM